MAEETKTTPEEKTEPMEQLDEKEPIKENGSAKEEKDEKEQTVEDGGDSEDDGESSEEELGLLERPVEILDRKRDRKSTERLALEKFSKPKTPRDELDFETGRGKKLGDIPYVKHMLDKTPADDLKFMHRLLFFKQQKVTMVKKSIRTFCGYPFDKESKFYERADDQMNKLVMPALRLILGILGLEKVGDKIAVKERLLEFLMEPKDLEKPIPGKKPKAAKKTPKKKKKKSPSKKSSSKKEGNSTEDVSEASESENDEEEKGEDDEKKEVASAEKKKKSPKKKAAEKKEKPKKTEKKKPKQPTIKLPTPKKKKAAASPAKKRKADDDSDDDKPLVKKVKEEPSDADLKKVVSSILKDADLEQITMKTVVKQVYDKYPNVDLTPRKDFIKNTVKEIIS